MNLPSRSGRAAIRTVLCVAAVCVSPSGPTVAAEPASDAAPAADWGSAPNPYFLPEGRRFGDTFPIFKDGQWHLFCMWMPHFGHFVSRDLLHWEKRPETPFGGATGCVIEHQGKFYMFYTGAQNINLATSDDLDRWRVHDKNPVVQGDDKLYQRANFRDAFVLFNEDEKLWWMLFGTRLMHQPGQRAGCVGVAKSKDLLHWQLAPPLWAPNIGPHTDCPQLIQHGKRWYLIYLQRHTRYRVADSPSGPWRRAPIRDLDSRMAAAGSRPATDGTRWISFPFLVTPKEHNDLGSWGYGGELAVPRQWGFQEDGSITVRPADEIVRAVAGSPAGRRKPLEGARPLIGKWDLTEGRTARSSNNSGGTLLLTDTPANFYFQADVTLGSEDMDAHLLMNVKPDLTVGYQLSLHPRTDRATLRAISYWDTDRVLETAPVKIDAGRPFKLRVFRSGSIVEAFFDDKAVLTHRLFQHKDGTLALEFRDGPGAFSNILIRRLARIP
ncbi:MAG: GH32 C-terminal domain-containing protein [Candidatus Nealsonbacteria bacterium]|nr:GH32 C-terminal domain-containing protein [Candidatus Nealsonbacteria bacterium]